MLNLWAVIHALSVSRSLAAHSASQIVSIWSEIQRSGNADANEAPTLSNGAPEVVLRLLDCLVSIGVKVAHVSSVRVWEPVPVHAHSPHVAL